MSHRTAITAAAHPPEVAQPARAESRTPFRLMGCLLATLSFWHQRSRQRTALAGLDDRMLKDIGLSRTDVLREGRKPFWQR